MENRDKKAFHDFATSGSLGVFLRKSTKKNMKMLHAGVILSKQKKIFGDSLIDFKKTLKFHQYIRPITSQHSILRCDFFQYFEIDF